MSEITFNQKDTLPENATNEGVLKTIEAFEHNKAEHGLSETGESILQAWKDEAVKRGLITTS